MRELPAAEPGGWKVALGHRRLSILDLSDAGRQPMCYRGRLWLTFNGEIYNYVELRRELERLGAEFRSQTDTEVILAAYDRWGTDCFRPLPRHVGVGADRRAAADGDRLARPAGDQAGLSGARPAA